jgi:hypothetical protein
VIPNVGPVLRAARADGAAGTFTADRLDCVQHPGHEQCTWYGTFSPADGGRPVHDTTLYGAGRSALAEGESTPAVDVGRRGRVYSPDGSNEWVVTGLFLVAGVGLLAASAVPRRRPRPA